MLLLRLSLSGLKALISTKETGHNLDAKAVTDISDKKKQLINTRKGKKTTSHDLNVENAVRNSDQMQQHMTIEKPHCISPPIFPAKCALGSLPH